MQVSKCTIKDLETALETVNKKYDGNIEFKRLETKGRKIVFTLKLKGGIKKPKDGIIKGAAINQLTGRRTGSACWHIHGHLFEELIKITPEVKINSIIGEITKDGGNWISKKIGSPMCPYYMHEACDCDSWDESIKYPKGYV